jgi:hypothetical protein
MLTTLTDVPSVVRAKLDAHAPGWQLLQGMLRIRTTEWCHIDVHWDLFTALVCETLPTEPHRYRRGWRYAATNSDSGVLNQSSLIAAINGALDWNGAPDTEPQGWYQATSGKPGDSERRRPDGDHTREYPLAEGETCP